LDIYHWNNTLQFLEMSLFASRRSVTPQKNQFLFDSHIYSLP